MKTLSTTRDGKWLLTADFEDDCAVVVWDTDKRQDISSPREYILSRKAFSFHLVLEETERMNHINDRRTPVCTLFHPHGSEGMTAARISPDAKEVVTVGNERCQNVHFWLWTYGRDTPDGSPPFWLSIL